jgi:hypothetical protein
VSTTPANAPRKSIQGVVCTPKTLPASTPKVISMMATEMPNSTDMTEATTISTPRIAAVVTSFI